MSYLVTLDVFSGRENPTWVIPDSEAGDVQTRLRAAEKDIAGGRPSDILGYRGVRITPIERQDVSKERLLESAGEDDGSVYISGVPELEDYLLATGGGLVDDVVGQHVREILAQPQLRYPSLEAAVVCPKCQAADAPAYNPGFWNDPARQPHNNCYNYANNQATNTFAQPGRATGRPITGLTCQGVQPSAQSDGLAPSAGFNAPLAQGKGWYVALVMWPGVDYHWYRQDDGGCWSHKPGQTPATDLDNSGQKIADPRTCNRGGYTDFCTYMITGNWVRIN
ncbi:hypothetical protein [uncultured Roseibium sp.]|uniref:hypothetical protein n=1 Tax=uncultured Roseibium sp. TaxID=1936171 RepID=UPI003216EA2B